ncbi:MAG: hypothetical protein R3B70_10785 [Polyangiaceae bacterium]
MIATLGACDGTEPDAKGSASASATAAAPPAPSASSSAGASASASSAPAGPAYPAEWTDLDLTPAGKLWAEYTLKGPADAKVKKGFPDPSIEAGDYGLSLSLTYTKKSTASLDTARAYGVSWRALTDTPELFEYETSGEQNGEKFVRYNFSMFVKVDGKTIGCSGLNNQKEREKLAPMMAACRTLRKK